MDSYDSDWIFDGLTFLTGAAWLAKLLWFPWIPVWLACLPLWGPLLVCYWARVIAPAYFRLWKWRRVTMTGVELKVGQRWDYFGTPYRIIKLFRRSKKYADGQVYRVFACQDDAPVFVKAFHVSEFNGILKRLDNDG